MTMNAGPDFSIVAVDKFIQATRDSGYKGTSSAVAELVDNSLQAGATEIAISVTVNEREDAYPVVLSVIDNGSGMDAHTLRTALRFGGSTRFDNRRGLGRYGMGLPNSSFSQAKRVTVHSWTSKSDRVLNSYLDLDEIASGAITEVPEPEQVPRPHFENGHDTGTAVTWSRCDRLDNKRVSTLARKLLFSLGRRFRHFLWDGVTIKVNGDARRADGSTLPSCVHSFQRSVAVRRGICLRDLGEPRTSRQNGNRASSIRRTSSCGMVVTQQPRETRARDCQGRGRLGGPGKPRSGLRMVFSWRKASRELRRLVALRESDSILCSTRHSG